MNIQLMFQDWMDWSGNKFKQATQLSSLEKCREEIDEIKKDIENNIYEDLAIEYADAIMCLLHSAHKSGFDAKDILFAFKSKFIINKKRNWKLNENQTYSHE